MAKPTSLGAPAPELDVLDLYAKDVARSGALLSREEEAALGRRPLAGDKEAQDELVRRNLRFVISIAKRFRGRGRSFADLIQDGNIGLMMAARRFDPSVGVRFASYAVSWILQQIQSGLDGGNGDVRPTKTQMVRVRKVRRLQREARQRMGRDYTVDELVALTGYTPERVIEALDYREGERSMDAPTNPYDESAPGLDEILNLTSDDADEQEHARELREVVGRMLREVLDDRERRVLEWYHGLGNRREYSLHEIGLVENVSRERARQIAQRARAKLKEAKANYPELAELFVTKAGLAQRTGMLN